VQILLRQRHPRPRPGPSTRLAATRIRLTNMCGFPEVLACLVLAVSACGHSGTSEVASTSADTGSTLRCDGSSPCPVGQTCGTLDGRRFSCMPSGPGHLDDRCDSSTSLAPLCADGLTCLGTSHFGAGTCVAWCGGAQRCPADKTCKSVKTTLGVAIAVCLPCSTAYACGAGETCATKTGESFSCMPAGTQNEGAACDASVGAAVVCGERLVCLAVGSPKLGICSRFCDNTHPCAGGRRCKSVLTTKGVMLPVCV
jgi:hypothetical protein